SIVGIDDSTDPLPGGGKKHRMTNPDLIHELDPSVRAGIFETPVGCSSKCAGRRARQRILDVAIQWKYAAPQPRAGRAKRKMTSDAIAIFEDMSVAIDNLNLADSSEFLLKVLPSQTSAFLRRRAR